MSQSESRQTVNEELLSILRCPVTGSRLRLENGFLVSEVGGLRYLIRDGIPVLLPEEAKFPAGIESLDAFKRQFADQITRKPPQ